MACSTWNIIATSWPQTFSYHKGIYSGYWPRDLMALLPDLFQAAVPWTLLLAIWMVHPMPCPSLWLVPCVAWLGGNDTGPVGELDKWMILPGQLCVLTLCDRKLSCNRRSFIFGGHLGAQSTFLLQATLIYLLLGLLSTLWTSSTSKSSQMKVRSLLFARLPTTWLATHRSVACWLWALGAGATVSWR